VRAQDASNLCEWSPLENAPASIDSGCINQATVSVGRGRNNFHVCASCAVLPRFNRYKYRKEIGAK